MAMIKDSGSNYQFGDTKQYTKVPKSNLLPGYVNTFTLNQGEIVPFYWSYTYPGDVFKISIENVLRVVNPPVVALMSRQRMFCHVYWLSFTQLWKDAQIFFSKGRTKADFKSSSAIRVPRVTIPCSFERGSLADYLGVNVVNSSSSYEVPALKFMAYIKVWRDMYCNQRLVSQDLEEKGKSNDDFKVLSEFLFPVDDEDFRIGSFQWSELVKHDNSILWLFQNVKFRDWTDDYFTTAQTTPTYADDPSISTTVFGNSYVTWANDLVLQSFPTLGHHVNSNSSGSPTGPNYLTYGPDNSSTPFPGYTPRVTKNQLNSNTVSFSDMVSSLTINQIRECLSSTLILEKMARTDGSYGEYAQVMFGESPSSSRDMRPRYIGGTYQSIIFNQVVNTGGNESLQGRLTGQASSASTGDIGTFKSDDYGIILGVCSIMPDTYYCQGSWREDCYETSEDFYLPDREGLGMQAILNKEIYNDPSDSDNDGVFGYQNRFDEMRYRANEVHGKVADKDSRSFFPYIQTRFFNSRPTLTPEFLTTKDNIPKDWMTSVSEVPYIVQFANRISAIRPISYRATPATLGFN